MEQSPERRDRLFRAQGQGMQLGLEKGDKYLRIHGGHMAPFFMPQSLNPENKLLFLGTSGIILS